jgi:hypothetical protein
VTDDTIQAVLAGLQRLSFVSKPPGTIAISRSAVIDRAREADIDFEAVTAWVTERGGQLVTPPPTQSQTLRPRRRLARTVQPESYYVLPRDALGS